MAAPKSTKLNRVISDPLRKNLFQIVFELSYYSLKHKRFAKEYISRYCYRKGSKSLDNYVMDFEVGILQCSRILHSDESASRLIDKLAFYHFCTQHNIPSPKILAYNHKTQLFDFNQEISLNSLSQFKDLCVSWIKSSPHKSIFIKPVDGKGGTNAYRIDESDLSDDAHIQKVYTALTAADFIIQETVIQHEAIAKISPYSINTLRIDTYKPLNEPSRVMSALMRFGRKGAVVDNQVSSGGLFISVDLENECLKGTGIQMITTGNHSYSHHPDTQTKLDKAKVPYLKEAIALVNEACEKCGDRLVGWDVCIGPDGPLIIEGNHNYHIVMQEVAYGGYRNHPDFIRVLKEENIV